VGQTEAKLSKIIHIDLSQWNYSSLIKESIKSPYRQTNFQYRILGDKPNECKYFKWEWVWNHEAALSKINKCAFLINFYFFIFSLLDKFVHILIIIYNLNAKIKGNLWPYLSGFENILDIFSN
jgi:hypothetical protein